MYSSSGVWSVRTRIKALGQRVAGFTLAELAVAMLVVGVVAAIAVPNFLGARNDAFDREAQSTVSAALRSADAYYANSGDFSSSVNAACNAANDTALVSDVQRLEPNVSFVVGGVPSDNPHVVSIATANSYNADSEDLGCQVFYAAALSRSGTCFVGRLAVEGKYLGIGGTFPITVSSDASASNAAVDELVSAAANGRSFGAIRVDASAAGAAGGTETLAAGRNLCAAQGFAAVVAGINQRTYYDGWRTTVAWSQDAGSSVPPPSAVISLLAAGNGHSCTVRADTTVQCWGANDSGQLGDGTNLDSNVALVVSGIGGTGALSNVVSVTAGGVHSCALLADGTVQCWGYNGEGELGDGTTIDSNAPVVVSGLSGVVSIAAGDSHTCAVLSSGAVWCWGANAFGQLGDGTIVDASVPVNVKDPAGTGSLSGVAMVAVGDSHSCAVSSAGGAFCWGYNFFGQLGDGTTNRSSVPVVVADAAGTGVLSNVSSISVGADHSCVLSAVGGVLCWGYNDDGQLGNGSTTASPIPVVVSGASGTGALAAVTAISAGSYHTCALTSAGVLCWGYNDDGQLGNNTTTSASHPVVVSGLIGAGSISGGGTHSCALSSGVVQCWGDNTLGQLGNGTFVSSPVPV
ncbi:unannotated protein [freshwater metagenome]|uniref:Unannotated protein n=1 Tax=freshwater metagenome TaxID=449393 RepID=A0A6J7E2E3_9ZZZZ